MANNAKNPATAILILCIRMGEPPGSRSLWMPSVSCIKSRICGARKPSANRYPLKTLDPAPELKSRFVKQVGFGARITEKRL
jgi:hypothetical protein